MQRTDHQLHTVTPNVVQAMSHEAYRAAAKSVGVTVEMACEALIHAREIGAPGLQAAMWEHVETGKPATYARYVQEYVSTLDQTPEGRARIMSANGDMAGRFYDSGNEIVVTLPDGTQIRWADAIAQRILTVG